MGGAKAERVEYLQGRSRTKSRQSAAQPPADDAGGAPQPHQTNRPTPPDHPAPIPEQHDLGDPPSPPQPADHRVGKAETAPVERAEAVVELMARLDRRHGSDKQPEAPDHPQPPHRPPPRPPARPAEVPAPRPRTAHKPSPTPHPP